MRVLTIFTFVCLFFSFALTAQADWYSIASPDPAPPEISVVQSDLSGTSLYVELGGVELQSGMIDGVEYMTLSMPNTPRRSQPGAPDIPMISTWVAVPPMADVEINVYPGEFELLTGKDVAPYSDYSDPEMWNIDPDIYQSSDYFPQEMATISKPQIFRDVRFVPVQIYPIQVNPVMQEVVIYTTLNIEIRTRGTNGINPKTTISPAPSPTFEKHYQKRMINYEQLKPYLFSNLRDAPAGLELLIISPDNLVAGLDELVEWKNKKGIRTYVAPFSETGSTNSSIKNYIQDLYDDPETRPEHVLFIGDGNVCPAWTTTGNISDNPYGYLEGNDETLDMFLGRFPCNNSILSLLTMVNRTLEYEQNPVNDGSDWIEKATLICPQSSSMETKFELIGDRLLDEIGEYQVIDEYNQNGGGGDVIQTLNNEGRSILNYRGYISDYGVTPDRVDPQGKYPFVTWLTCGKCNYASNDLCVRWMRDGSADYPEGSIGSIAGSQVTTPEPYARRRDSLDRGMYEAMFLENMYTMGEILLWGKEVVVQDYPPPDIYTEDTYNHFSLMGDPTTKIWTKTPQDLVVEHMEIIPLGVFDYTVHVENESGNDVRGAKVALTNLDQEVFFVGRTNVQGNVTLPLTIDTLDEYDLVVTAHNYLPYEATVESVPGMAFEGIVTDSETGNPVPATIFIEGGYRAYADVETGFYRLYVADAGEYTLQAERWGYEPYESEMVTIGEDDTITVDIVMNPYSSGIIEGYVRDMAYNPVVNAAVIAFNEVDQPPVYTDENGFYQIICPGSYTYDVRVQHPDQAPHERSIAVPIDGTVTLDFRLALMEDFEGDDDGDFEEDRSPGHTYCWEQGIPTEEGGPMAYTGTGVWGTTLDGFYPPYQNAFLVTPEYFLVPDADAEYELQVYHWYEMEDERAGGNVKMSLDGGENWQLLTPEGGYPDPSVEALPGEPGFTGDSDGWQLMQFDLDEYINESIQFRFRFSCPDSTRHYKRGWFLDHFVIYGSEEPFGDTFDISGNIRYANEGYSVANVELSLNDDYTAMTNAGGNYLFTAIPADNYTLTPVKEDDVNGVSAFDAARISQYSVGMYDFDEYQILAADVTADGNITPFDAARVLQYSSGMPHHSRAGEWGFVPGEYTYTPLNEDMHDQDFRAVIFGEVTGNWDPPMPNRKQSSEQSIVAAESTIEMVKTDQNVVLKSNDVSTMNVFAFQFIIESDRTLSAELTNVVPEDWQMAIHQQSDSRWFVGAYGVTPLSKTDLVEIRGDANLTIIDGLINEIPVKTNLTTATPAKYALHANYPNPFNPKTTIAFDLPIPSQVSLDIYDVSGQLIKSLTVNEELPAGYHTYVWDGTNGNGQAVRSGVYFYRLTAEDFSDVQRMVLLK